MPLKSSETRPQQGRGQTIKTKCPHCKTYIQSVYMKIDGKLVSVDEECPNCYEGKKKNELNHDELEAILEALNLVDTNNPEKKNERFYELLDGIREKCENKSRLI